MSLSLGLATLGVRYLADAAGKKLGFEGGDAAAKGAFEFLRERFTDHAADLTDALAESSAMAWQVLEFSLGGDALWQKCKNQFARKEDQKFREHFRNFLDSVPDTVLPEGSDRFRTACLAELKAARKAKLLEKSAVDLGQLAKHVAVFAKYSNPGRVLEAEFATLHEMADLLPTGFPSLKKLLRTHPDGQMPLLVLATRYYFRQAVANNPPLASALALNQMQTIAERQSEGFDSLEKALATHANHLDELMAQTFDHMVRSYAIAVETRDDVIFVKGGVERVEEKQNQTIELLKTLAEILQRNDLEGSEVGPELAGSVQSDAEIAAIRELKRQYDSLPPTTQPDAKTLNELGKAQIAVGDFESAERLFTKSAATAPRQKDAAVAHHNSYRAALERCEWGRALDHLRLAVKIDPDRFEPFPFIKLKPEKIIGAGGFGVAFACHDYAHGYVVVKALSPSEINSDVDTVVEEAKTLNTLHHDNIIGFVDWGYGDNRNGRRPYLVMRNFAGCDLNQYVSDNGKLSTKDLLVVARSLASALAAAHTRNICHLDVKPQNVLIRKRDGSVAIKLIDFGLAIRHDPRLKVGKSHLANSVRGTYEYGSPEQLGQLPSAKIGKSSDIYSYAKTCLFALSGNPDLRGRELKKLPSQLTDLLDHCLERNPDDRPASFDEVIVALNAIDLQSFNKMSQPVRPKPVPMPSKQVAPLPKPEASESKPTPVVVPPTRHNANQKRPSAMSLEEKVGEMLQREIKLSPDDSETLTNYVNFLIKVQKDYDAAEEVFQRAIANDPKNAGLLYEYAVFLHNIRDDFDAAMEIHQQAIALDPKIPRDMHGEARFYKSTERNAVARDLKTRPAVLSTPQVNDEGRKTDSPSPQIGEMQTSGLAAPFSGHEESITCIACSPDGSRVASGDAKTLRIWHLKTGAQVYCIDVTDVKSIEFSSDGTLLGCANVREKKTRVALFNAWTGKLLREYDGGQAFSFSPDGTQLAIVRFSHIEIYDVQSGMQLRSLKVDRESWLGNSGFESLDFSSDGRLLVSGGWDGVARLWDANSGKQISKIKVCSGFFRYIPYVRTVAISPHGLHLLTSARDGTLRLWQLNGGRQIARFREQVIDAAFSPNGGLVLVKTFGKSELWDLVKKKKAIVSGHEAAFCPDGRQIVVADYSNKLVLYNVAELRESFRSLNSSFWYDRGKHAFEAFTLSLIGVYTFFHWQFLPFISLNGISSIAWAIPHSIGVWILESLGAVGFVIWLLIVVWVIRGGAMDDEHDEIISGCFYAMLLSVISIISVALLTWARYLSS